MNRLALDDHVLAQAYCYLRATHPFRHWRLPGAESIRFRVARSRLWLGQCHGGAPRGIDISAALVGHTATLLTVMAHEMIHLKQAVAGSETKAAHNAEFARLAARVCRIHGFDPLAF